MMFCRLFRMVRSMYVMAMCDVGVVTCYFLATAFLMLGRFKVMASCKFMVLRRFFVVFCTLFAHRVCSFEVLER